MSQLAFEGTPRHPATEVSARSGVLPTQTEADVSVLPMLAAEVATLFTRAPLAVQLYDHNGTLIWMNERHRALFGLPDLNHGIGKFSLINDAQARTESQTEQYARALAGELVQLSVSVRPDSSARAQLLEQKLLPLYGPAGEVAALLVLTSESAALQNDPSDAEQLHRSVERRAYARKVLHPDTLLARLQHEAAAAQRTIAILEARQIQELQRYESLGLLARSIAHDFNNLLTRIQGNADLVMLSIEDNTPELACDSLEQIGNAVKRAARLTNHILSYHGRTQTQPELVNLNKIIDPICDFIKNLRHYQAQINHDLASDLPPLCAEAVQVRQIILNLLLNAVEAVGDKPGAVSLRTACVTLSRAELDHLLLGAEAAPGCFVYLSVSDSGDGIDDANMARIFEPFFTTRLLGRGLGLTAVHDIVREYCGALRVTSTPGQGATFEVWLPAAE
jgi:signal transduction histidine kinase